MTTPDENLPSGSELGDSEIDEWAEVADVDDVLSASEDGSKQPSGGSGGSPGADATPREEQEAVSASTSAPAAGPEGGAGGGSAAAAAPAATAPDSGGSSPDASPGGGKGGKKKAGKKKKGGGGDNGSSTKPAAAAGTAAPPTLPRVGSGLSLPARTPSLTSTSVAAQPPASTAAAPAISGSSPRKPNLVPPPSIKTSAKGQPPPLPSRRPPPLKSAFGPSIATTPKAAAASSGSVRSSRALVAPPSVEITADDYDSAGEDRPVEDEEQESGDGLWGGWSNGWKGLGLGSISSAVGNAVKDVKDLGSSFQQVLSDIADDVDRDARGLTQPREGEGSEEDGQGGEGEQQAARPIPRVSSGMGFELDDHQAEVLGNLAGPETGIQRGLKSLDEGVETLANGAFRSLGGIFSVVSAAASSAAREVLDTVEEGVKDIQDLPAVKAASTGLTGAPTRAKGLFRGSGDLYQRIGGFLEGNVGALLEAAGLDHATATGKETEPATFEQCFRSFGGSSSLEELEVLANECARAVNRARAKLPPGGQGQQDGGQAEMDALLASLHSYFDLQTSQVGEQQQQQRRDDDKQLAEGHSMVHELCVSGIDRTAQVSLLAERQAALLAANASDGPPAASSPSSSRGVDGEPEAAAAAGTGAASETAGGDGAEAAGSSGGGGEEDVGPSGGSSSQGGEGDGEGGGDGGADERAASACGFLSGAHQEGVRRVAELAALCVERLLALARSLAAQYRYGRPASDGISWPAGGTDKAVLLRREAQRMAGELQALAAAWRALLPSVAATLEAGLLAPASSPSSSSAPSAAAAAAEAAAALQQAAKELVSGWDADVADAASERLQGGLRGLLYVVLYSTLDRQLLEQ